MADAQEAYEELSLEFHENTSNVHHEEIIRMLEQDYNAMMVSAASGVHRRTTRRMQRHRDLRCISVKCWDPFNRRGRIEDVQLIIHLVQKRFRLMQPTVASLSNATPPPSPLLLFPKLERVTIRIQNRYYMQHFASSIIQMLHEHPTIEFLRLECADMETTWGDYDGGGGGEGGGITMCQAICSMPNLTTLFVKPPSILYKNPNDEEEDDEEEDPSSLRLPPTLSALGINNASKKYKEDAMIPKLIARHNFECLPPLVTVHLSIGSMDDFMLVANYIKESPSSSSLKTVKFHFVEVSYSRGSDTRGTFDNRITYDDDLICSTLCCALQVHDSKYSSIKHVSVKPELIFLGDFDRFQTDIVDLFETNYTIEVFDCFNFMCLEGPIPHERSIRRAIRRAIRRHHARQRNENLLRLIQHLRARHRQRFDDDYTTDDEEEANQAYIANLHMIKEQINYYLKLNISGKRKFLLQSSSLPSSPATAVVGGGVGGDVVASPAIPTTATREDWLDVIIENKTDLSIIYYLIRHNPSLCNDCRSLSSSDMKKMNIKTTNRKIRRW